jgi:siroheme synthase-like protein
MRTLPIRFSLRDRLVVFVGGEPALADELRRVFSCGGEARLVAETLDDLLLDALRHGRGVWERRKLAPRDLHDASLALIATGSGHEDELSARIARAARVPLAVIGRPDLSDFVIGRIDMDESRLAHGRHSCRRDAADAPPAS